MSKIASKRTQGACKDSGVLPYVARTCVEQHKTELHIHMGKPTANRLAALWGRI